jgi:hypothetical protein
MQKGQQTEDQTCTKLGPGRLGAQMETHQPPSPPVGLLYTEATWGGEAFLRGGGMTLWSPGIGGTCDSFSLNINIIGKTALLHLAHFCSGGCANQASNANTGHNYTCSLLQFGAVLNSNTQLIQYTCGLPTRMQLSLVYIYDGQI